MDVISIAATVCLALLTAVYVGLTARIAKDSAKSAASSELAALASREAAQSAAKSALVAEAQLQVAFETSVTRFPDGKVWIQLTSTSSRVFVHSVTATMSAMISKEDLTLRFPKLSILKIPETQYDKSGIWPEGALDKLPCFFRAGDTHSFEWLDPLMVPSDYGCFGFLFVTYSLVEDSERHIASVNVRSDPGIDDLITDPARPPKMG